MALLTDLLITLSYGVVGIALMSVGYLLVDIATPGKLHVLIWENRNTNAAVLLVSNLIGVAIIVVAAIAASHDDFVQGLISTLAYGVVGLLLMAVAFLLLDAVTPGRLGEILVQPERHPAVWVTATIHIAAGAIIAAAIS
ncbi:DUF350 domain-containing protein [Catenuloplanes sp. NPDC051500]|uniref:DUF350 domain-containing protein n=1 Tax=Catenuloplanes sp. NPDC051500 TaxID=3363959 RepID=UPI003787F80B